MCVSLNCCRLDFFLQSSVLLDYNDIFFHVEDLTIVIMYAVFSSSSLS